MPDPALFRGDIRKEESIVDAARSERIEPLPAKTTATAPSVPSAPSKPVVSSPDVEPTKVQQDVKVVQSSTDCTDDTSSSKTNTVDEAAVQSTQPILTPPATPPVVIMIDRTTHINIDKVITIPLSPSGIDSEQYLILILFVVLSYGFLRGIGSSKRTEDTNNGKYHCISLMCFHSTILV